MNALVFIVDTLMSLVLFVFLARLLLQWARADFQNPVAQAVVRITNPVIRPLRRVLPPMGRIDTASVVAVLAVTVIKVAVLFALLSYGTPAPELWIQRILIELVTAVLHIYLYAILLYALLSMIAPGGYSPFQSILENLCEPVLRPFRRLIPPIAGLDLSPLWAIIAIQAILLLLP